MKKSILYALIGAASFGLVQSASAGVGFFDHNAKYNDLTVKCEGTGKMVSSKFVNITNPLLSLSCPGNVYTVTVEQKTAAEPDPVLIKCTGVVVPHKGTINLVDILQGKHGNCVSISQVGKPGMILYQ